MKIIMLVALFALIGCSTTSKNNTFPAMADHRNYQQCQQQLEIYKQSHDDIKEDFQTLLQTYQQCRQRASSYAESHGNTKQDYRDARQDYQQCQRQAIGLKSKIQSCKNRLNLYKNNQENYKQLPNKGFE